MSGRNFNKEHPLNKRLIHLTLPVFQFDISGRDITLEHFENIPDISVIFLVFQIDISGKENKDEHPLNKLFIFTTL